MAAEYFNRLAKDYPGRLHPLSRARRSLHADQGIPAADADYQQAYKLAPENPVIIANAANAAIEAQQIKLAGVWVNRAKGKMNDDPRVMRERERYLLPRRQL